MPDKLLQCSGREPLGVPREERGLADVMKAAEELNDTLETEASTSMCWRTIAERLDIVLNRLNRDVVGLCTLSKHNWIMNTLGTRGDLLTTHEEIVRVGVIGVVGVEHRVEGTSVDRVAVEHIEVSIIALLDDATKSLLGFS